MCIRDSLTLDPSAIVPLEVICRQPCCGNTVSHYKMNLGTVSRHWTTLPAFYRVVVSLGFYTVTHNGGMVRPGCPMSHHHGLSVPSMPILHALILSSVSYTHLDVYKRQTTIRVGSGKKACRTNDFLILVIL